MLFQKQSCLNGLQGRVGNTRRALTICSKGSEISEHTLATYRIGSEISEHILQFAVAGRRFPIAPRRSTSGFREKTTVCRNATANLREGTMACRRATAERCSIQYPMPFSYGGQTLLSWMLRTQIFLPPLISSVGTKYKSTYILLLWNLNSELPTPHKMKYHQNTKSQKFTKYKYLIFCAYLVFLCFSGKIYNVYVYEGMLPSQWLSIITSGYL